MKDVGLARRVALVTGANHGIGAATARALAAADCDVFIQFLRYRPPDEAGADQRMQDAAKIVREISEAGGRRASSWETDLADPSNVPALFDRVEKDLGPVEILVNNAAVTERDSLDPREDARDWGGRPIAHITAETIDRNFAVNTRAVALMMAEYAKRHVVRGAKWGRIINLSTDGSASFPGEVSYGASKYATESYSRAAAGELGRFGIAVNIVSPGPTDTGWITPAMVPDMERMAPLGRVGKPRPGIGRRTACFVGYRTWRRNALQTRVATNWAPACESALGGGPHSAPSRERFARGRSPHEAAAARRSPAVRVRYARS